MKAVTGLGDGRDEVLVTLDGLAGTMAQTLEDDRLLARRVNQLRAGRSRGRSWQELLAREDPPATMELASRSLRRLSETSGALRRALARGLRAEGASIPAIAKAFGVSHQRVSSLLQRGER